MKRALNLKKPRSFGLTEDGYFPNFGDDCVISSLANLIYFKYDDFETAQKLFIQSKNHPLVKKDLGVHIISMPTILSNLSDGKYFGVLHFIPKRDFLKLKDKAYSKILKSVFEKSVKEGLIDSNFEGDFPCPKIFLLMQKENNSIYHAVVDLEDSYTIDNGQIENKRNLSNEWNYIGIFEIYKNE